SGETPADEEAEEGRYLGSQRPASCREWSIGAATSDDDKLFYRGSTNVSDDRNDRSKPGCKPALGCGSSEDNYIAGLSRGKHAESQEDRRINARSGDRQEQDQMVAVEIDGLRAWVRRWRGHQVAMRATALAAAGL